MAVSKYKLSASLIGHEDDVKSIAVTRDGEVVSVSRDCTVRKWIRDPTSPGTWHQNVLYKDEKYLNAVSSNSSGDKVIFGGQSKAVVSLDNVTVHGTAATTTLGSHDGNVCTLAVGHGLIVSGSWDSTARVWSIESGKPLYTLEGHQASVWAVLIISDTRLITAAADKNIFLWENGKKIGSINSAHDDAIRGLCRLNSDTFASCSNDTTIKIWSLDSFASQSAPSALLTLTGHSSFIYTISSNGKTLLSGGEDRSLRVWDLTSNECIQVITLPSTSVWSVAYLNETDVLAAGSDNIIRVFSRDPEKWASEDELKHLEQAVASTGLGKDQTGGKIDESQISDAKVLTQPGTKEGQVVMVRGGSGGPGAPIEAHQWSTGMWVKIGEVVDSATSGKKTLYEGVEYDYVFDVDIREGVPPLKLPYNLTQNPYEVAQSFVEKYELSPGYVDEVAKFLIANTETVDLTSQPAQDPYSSGRYIPGGGHAQSSNSAQTAISKSSESTADLHILPFTETVSLVSYSPDPIIRALRTNNDKYSSGKLSPAELASIENTLKSGITPESAQEIFRYFVKIEQSWTGSRDDLLPALDILRIIVPSLNVPPVSLVQTVFNNMDPDSIKTTLLATRVIVNLFTTPAGLKLALNPQIRENALEILSPIVRDNKSTKPLNLAIATLLLNYSSATTDPNSGFELLTAIGAFKSTTTPLDSETAYRLLLALGTTLTNAITASATIKDAAINLDLLEWAKQLAKQLEESRINDLLVELSTVLS
ncbi:Doa1p [Sugiyamaella lignohabitans]|uniref:Doa1p n=1 Tax=Sugiyamaella lignohabitans TaxID=796027 RepID=A0A167FWY3_9ASCO|nr:Doa1p [Sugiyamaella lignohabitans]ANB15806.1 Doa1p [Sugiyamaella lignohabitans]